MSPENPSKARSGSTQSSSSPSKPTVDVEAIVRRLHDENYSRCDWHSSSRQCGHRCTYTNDVRAAVNATMAALPPESEVERLRELLFGDGTEAPGGGYGNAAWRGAWEAREGEVERLRAEVVSLTQDRDEWAQACRDGNYRFERAEAEVSQLRARVAELEDIDKVCDHNIAEANRLLEREASLESQLAASQAALRRYGEHQDDEQQQPCPASVQQYPKREFGPCHCGLDAALAALPERPAGGE